MQIYIERDTGRTKEGNLTWNKSYTLYVYLIVFFCTKSLIILQNRYGLGSTSCESFSGTISTNFRGVLSRNPCPAERVKASWENGTKSHSKQSPCSSSFKKTAYARLERVFRVYTNVVASSIKTNDLSLWRQEDWAAVCGAIDDPICRTVRGLNWDGCAWFPCLAVSCQLVLLRFTDTSPCRLLQELEMTEVTKRQSQGWFILTMLEVFFPPVECSPIFDRKFVEISSQTRSMQSRLRNPSLDHKHDRTSFVRVCFSPESCGYCRSAAALINEEMFGNRAPLFNRIVCGKPPSANAAHIHTHKCKSALDLLISLRQAADVAVAIFGPEWCAR